MVFLAEVVRVIVFFVSSSSVSSPAGTTGGQGGVLSTKSSSQCSLLSWSGFLFLSHSGFFYASDGKVLLFGEPILLVVILVSLPLVSSPVVQQAIREEFDKQIAQSRCSLRSWNGFLFLSHSRFLLFFYGRQDVLFSSKWFAFLLSSFRLLWCRHPPCGRRYGTSLTRKSLRHCSPRSWGGLTSQTATQTPLPPRTPPRSHRVGSCTSS